ncbi:MAG: hypothetical protein KDI16_00280 [Halioglobus sp.]|nr:hypothetical protein [Halioglobus sp.]
MARGFNAGSFLGRWVFAAALVFGTYNPTDYSYLSWVFSANATFGPVLALVGVLLLIGWIIFLRATFMSMGWLGIILGAAFFSCLIWLLVDLGWLNINAPGTISWLALLLLSVLLAVGMSWSHIRRRLTGQFDVDDVDD